MRFGSTTKLLTQRLLKYHRNSGCKWLHSWHENAKQTLKLDSCLTLKSSLSQPQSANLSQPILALLTGILMTCRTELSSKKKCGDEIFGGVSGQGDQLGFVCYSSIWAVSNSDMVVSRFWLRTQQDIAPWDSVVLHNALREDAASPRKLCIAGEANLKIWQLQGQV